METLETYVSFLERSRDINDQAAWDRHCTFPKR